MNEICFHLLGRLPVIEALAEEVRQTTQSLLCQLLQKLRSNIQLPECLRIIGYLRRTGVFSEYEMQLQFLRCRETWLTGILEDLNQRNAYEYLKGMVSYHRMHLFDVVNQYRAIFADDTSGSEENYDGGLLFSWAMHQIASHLKTLKVMLPKITEGGSLSNILDQYMVEVMVILLVEQETVLPLILMMLLILVVADSIVQWGSAGLDFRGLLPSVFEEVVLNLFSKNMNTAIENFQLVLDSHRWVPLPAVGFFATSIGEESQDDVTPPSDLMEHPPLAVFINGVSAAMNELRPCAPVSLKNFLAQELIKGLQAVSDSLRYNATRMLRGNESGLFLSLCRAFIENLYDGVGGLLTISSSKEPPKPVSDGEEKTTSENGDLPQPVVENGVESIVDETRSSNADSPTLHTDEKMGEAS
ncbi:hypothetical protein DITRI_Ditri03aG0036700 [Diplodiscus trichospermus]